MVDQPRVQYDRDKILAEAERGALLTHAHLTAGLKRQGVSDVDIVKRGKERVERAIAYAEWRMASYERGETVTPW